MDPPGPALDIAYHGTFAYALPCVGCPEPDPELDEVPAMAFLYLYRMDEHESGDLLNQMHPADRSYSQRIGVVQA